MQYRYSMLRILRIFSWTSSGAVFVVFIVLDLCRGTALSFRSRITAVVAFVFAYSRVD